MQRAVDSFDYYYGSIESNARRDKHQRESNWSASSSWWSSSDLCAPYQYPPSGVYSKSSPLAPHTPSNASPRRTLCDGCCKCHPALSCVSLKLACSWRTGYRGYFFRSRAVVLLLLMNALFSTALYGVTAELLKIVIGVDFALTRNFVTHGVTQILFPVAGHVADVYVGKHNVLRFSLWVAWLAFAAIAVAFSLDTPDNAIEAFNRYGVLPVAFAMLSVSYVCFVSTVLPFGIDQLQGASHVHFRSFFCWWYWTLNVGVILVNVPHYCKERLELSVVFQSGIGVLCISAALFLDAVFKKWFAIESKNSTGNPLSQIFKVLWGAASVSKDLQRVPSLVRHELDLKRLSRFDLIKDRYGGTFATEQVEDVMTFFRILLLLATVGFAVLTYAGVGISVSESARTSVRGCPVPLQRKTGCKGTRLSWFVFL